MANMNLLSKNIALVKLLSPLWTRTSLKTLSVNPVSLRQAHILASHRPISCLEGFQQRPLLTSGLAHKSVFSRTYHEEKAEQTQTEPEREENFEEHEQTIYKGILATQIKLVKSFSLMTSIIGLSCQPVIFMKMGAGSANIPLIIASGAFLSFFTFATPLLIHWVSKKYVVELVYNKIDDTYTAITYSLLLRKKQVRNRGICRGWRVKTLWILKLPCFLKIVKFYSSGPRFTKLYYHSFLY